MKKKVIHLLATLCMVFAAIGLIGCGKNENVSDSDSNSEQTQNVCTVVFDSQGGSSVQSQEVHAGQKLQKPTTPTKDGYTFDGWYVEEEKWSFIGHVVTENMTLTASWQPTQYLLVLVDYGQWGGNSEGSYTIETPTFTLPTPSGRQGYDFGGWYRDETLTEEVSQIEIGSYGDITFYAKWTAKTNTLRFDGNGNTAGIMENLEMDTAQSSPLPVNTFVRDGYTFIGWATSIYDGVVYADEATYTMGAKEQYTLYAIWQANLNTLRFDGNGNTGGEMEPMTISTDDAQGLPVSGFTKEGYYVKGWATTPDGEVAYTNGGYYFMGTNEEYTLYAVWETDVIYTLEGNAYTVYGRADAYLSNIIIFNEYNGRKVSKIGGLAFSYYGSLERITIPDSVTTIGIGAFEGCSSLVSIEISDGVTSIDSGAFYNCSSLESIEIPDGVTSIGSRAFENCSSLTSIEIPDGVTRIGSSAFENCSSLTSIEIPKSVISLYDGAFSGCSKLMSITVDENSTNYQSIDGNIYSKDGAKLIQYAIGKTATQFIIPENVTAIASGAFGGCSSLVEVVFADTTATWMCDSSLSRVEISVTDALANATYLTSAYSSYYWFKNS